MINKNEMTTIRFYRTSTKQNVILNKELEEILIGLLLGDLFAEKISNNHNTRLQFKQSYKNKEYIHHLYEIFSSFCKSKPVKMRYFDKRPNKNKIYQSIRFSTCSLPCFNKYMYLFYESNPLAKTKKYIPDELEHLLTARGLAYWIMDDGYKMNNGFYLCTDSYSLKDTHKLVHILKNKFNLNCGVHKYKNNYRLYIFSKSKNSLIQLIKSYLIPHFYYKFNI